MRKLLVLLISILAVSCGSGHKVSLEWSDSPTGCPAWRGERKGMRACVRTEVDLSEVRLCVSELKSGKSTIPSSAVRAQFVEKVMADVLDTTRFGQCGYRPAGLYDSLYVDEILGIVPSKNLSAGDVQQVWVTVAVPQDAEAGVYEGELQVKAGWLRKWTLPFTLEVLPETLPEPKEWKFHLDLWQNPYAVARYHNVEPWSDAHFEAMRPVMELLASAGQKVVTATILDRPWDGQTEDAFGSMVEKRKMADGSWKYDFTVFDKWVEFMFSLGIDKQVNCYSLIPWKLTFDYIDDTTGEVVCINAAPGEKAYADYWGSFIKAFAAHLREKGWFEKTMIAMDERPMEAMRKALRVIKRAEPDFKVSLAGNYHPEIESQLDDYCIALQQHFPSRVLSKRKAEGKVSTYYTCCAEAYPNTFVDSNPEEAVWIGWHAVAENYDGYLRWAYNSWTKDPLKDTRFRTWPAGDCFIVYPEGRSSVHFEKLIEGIQDYEKAQILMARWREDGNVAMLNRMNEALKAFTLNRLEAEGPEKALATVKALVNPVPECSGGEPKINVIFDTDIGGDIDDVLALQMLLNYRKVGRINIKAVTIVKNNLKSVSLTDGICRYNGFTDIPIGICANGIDPNDYYYLIPTLAAKNSYGEPLIRPKIDTTAVEDACRLMRRTLVETEGKTVIIAVGPLTNLQNLLLSQPDEYSPLRGYELVREKVSAFYVMGGMYEEENQFAECNVVTDVPAAQETFRSCQVPLVALGWEIGVRVPYPHQSVMNDFGNPMDHPLSYAYYQYARMPFDRPSWDEATVYLALEKDQDVYDLSENGNIIIDNRGYSLFVKDPNGRHNYVLLSKDKEQHAIDEIVRMTIAR